MKSLIDFCAIPALIFALLCATTGEAYAGGRVQCVKPNLQRQFIINKPYGEVMGSILKSQIEDLDGKISINKEGHIQMEDVNPDKQGQKIRTIEILEQQWERIDLKYDIEKSTLEGKLVGISKLRIVLSTGQQFTVHVKHDMEIGSDSTKITLQLLDEVSYQGARIKGCDGEVIFRKHGDQTIVSTRLMFHAHVCVPRCFPRFVSRIAWNVANGINCQTQYKMEQYIREIAAQYKVAKAVPTVMEMLKKKSVIPSMGLNFKKASISLWKDDRGKWKSKTETK